MKEGNVTNLEAVYQNYDKLLSKQLKLVMVMITVELILLIAYAQIN